MSFVFDSAVFQSGELETLLKDKLNGLLTNNNDTDTTKAGNISSTKSHGHISASDNNVFVKNISFNNKPPIIDILGMSILDSIVTKSSSDNENEFFSNSINHQTNDNKTVKTIVKLVIENFKIELKSDIESNLLLVYGGKNIDRFLLPDFVCNESFNIPINLTFTNCKLETILDLNYDIGSNVKMNFNDVNIAFEFDCSIPLLSSSIKQRLINNVDFIFKEVIPNAILDMSMKYMSKKKSGNNISQSEVLSNEFSSIISNDEISVTDDDCISTQQLLSYDEQETETASPVTMMKLSSIAAKRFSLSLRNFEEDDSVLERSNLSKILSKKTLKLSKLVESQNQLSTPNINSNTIYEATKAINVLPLSNSMIIDEKLTEQIADLQEMLHESTLRRNGTTKKFKRRKIKLNLNKTNEQSESLQKDEILKPVIVEKNIDEIVSPTVTSNEKISIKKLVFEKEKTEPISSFEIEKPLNLVGLRSDSSLLNSSKLSSNGSFILNSLPLAHNISTPSTPNGLMMTRSMTPLLFNDNSKTSSLPLVDSVKPMIQMNWKKNSMSTETDTSSKHDNKISINLDKTADSKGAVQNSYNASLDFTYKKLLEKTPLKNWVQTPSYLDNFAEVNGNGPYFGGKKTTSSLNLNPYKIDHAHERSLNDMLQNLQVAPPPYS
ncbi:hypothetical protein QEN19_001106 [Hanseniaspora menglaensis]